METQLTESENRLIRRLAHPWWPRLSLYSIIAWILFGAVAIALAIKDFLKLFHSPDQSVQPDHMLVFLKAWACLATGAIWLTVGIGLWRLRDFGRLIRKLANKTEHQKI